MPTARGLHAGPRRHHRMIHSRARELRSQRASERLADPEVDDVLAVIAHAVGDSRVPASVRAAISALQAEVDDSPLLAHGKLVRIGEPAAHVMPTHPPTTTLYRAVTLAVFFDYCVRPEFHMMSLTNYERAVRLAPWPDNYLTDSVDKTRTVFPASHSWLVESTDIETKTGDQISRLLELRHHPPFVLCRLTPASMAAAGVEVRPPTGLDAAIGLQPQWRSAGLPAGPEFVDRDISGAGVEGALWRP